MWRKSERNNSFSLKQKEEKQQHFCYCDSYGRITDSEDNFLFPHLLAHSIFSKLSMGNVVETEAPSYTRLLESPKSARNCCVLG